MSKLIIGFGHKRLRGKDTSANLITGFMAQIGLEVRRDSFASTLKDCCRIVFGFSDEQLYGDLKEVDDPFWGFSPRWALQTVGTEAFRYNVDPDIWVKCVERRYHQDDRSVVISDLRFENEAHAIKRMGGYVIRCDRDIPHEENKDQHPSEIGLDQFNEWDFVLDNNGTLDQLEAQLQEILLQIAPPPGE